MTPQVHIPNATSRGIIASLRPPCAQNLTLKQGYSLTRPKNAGQVLVLPSVSEPVTSPASGVIISVTRKPNTTWGHSAGDLDVHQTLEVKIDHGGYVYTTIHGLASVVFPVGQYVTRGDAIGTAKTTEIFFQLFYRNSPLDPATYSSFFRGYDGGKVPGKARKLRAGPDFITRAISDTVSYVMGGIRYFVDKYCTKPPVLVSIDFNGDGSKIGLGVVGFGASDHWNVYAPADFSSTDSYACYYTLDLYYTTSLRYAIYSADPVILLRDSNGSRSVIKLERVEPLTSEAGSSVEFDPMISTWVGGFDGFMVPITNQLRLTSIPPGAYNLYVYASPAGAQTDFYVAVNSASPTLKTAACNTGLTSFVLDDNYVVYENLVLSEGDVLTISASGALAGLQLLRI